MAPSRGRRGEAGRERGRRGGSEPPWEIQVYCQQRRVWLDSEPPRSRAAGERQGAAGGAGAGCRGPRAAAVRDGRRRGAAPRRSGRRTGAGSSTWGWLFPSRWHVPRRKRQGRSGPAGAGREKAKVRGESACERGKGEEKEEEGSGLHLPALRGAPAALKPTAQFYSLPRRNKKVAIY